MTGKATVMQGARNPLYCYPNRDCNLRSHAGNQYLSQGGWVVFILPLTGSAEALGKADGRNGYEVMSRQLSDELRGGAPTGYAPPYFKLRPHRT